MHQAFCYILDRLREKSTWAGIGSVLTGCGVVIKPEYWQTIMAIGMGVPGVIAVFLPDTVQEKNVLPTTAPTPLSKAIEEKTQ